MTEVLSEEEIIQFVNSIWTQAKLRKDFFGNMIPTHQMYGESVAQFAMVLDLFLIEFGFENYDVCDQEAASGIQNIERYGEWIVRANMCQALTSIFKARNVQFGMKDLITPLRKRAARFLSVLIHIWLHYTDVREKWDKIADEYASGAADKQNVKDEIAKLKNECEAKSLYLSQNRAKNHEGESELAALVEEYEKQKQLGTQLSDKHRELKHECAVAKEKISELSIQMGELNEEIANLEQKIVRSPEKIQAETDSKERSLEAKRTEKREREKEYMDIVKKVDVVREAIKEMKPSMDSLRETFNDMEKIREKSCVINELKDVLKTKLKQLQELQVVKQQNDANIVQLRQQIEKSKKQQKERLKTITDCNEKIRAEINSKTASMARNKEQEAMLEQERKIEADIEKLRNDLQTFENKYESLVARAKKGTNAVKNAINQAL